MISTGIKGLDTVITGLQLGDNVVWQIDAIEEYADFVKPFISQALQDKRKIIYIRFARHKALIKEQKGVAIHTLDPAIGFESFSASVNHIIKSEGEGVFYLFDCLSDLLSAWSNDLMIGNFFKITCPFLFELNTVTYFSLLRNSHSFKTVARIRDTTQLLIDVYRHEGTSYIHPIKVWNRYSPMMFLPHRQKGDEFVPIANSIDTAKLFSRMFRKGTKSITRKLDYWDKLFMDAEKMADQKGASAQRKRLVDQLCRLIIARDKRMLELAKERLTLEDLLAVKSRLVGTGFVGGKTVGMLIARNILLKDKACSAGKIFEPHDSFYIGSDVFYTYIVENGWWKSRMEQRSREGYFKVGKVLKEKLLSGVFPEEIKEQFLQMIEYFGQSPIIVRSSSLLEDAYGNAFAGKYESIFLANQGTPEERYARFVGAVKQVYASMMNEDALVYRLQRGLDQQDEQMALLVQRVSGAYHDGYFFPDVAGVGISYNTYVWKNTMDPKAGMLRLVLGLGTRAVNRVEGDYPRIAALDNPLLRTHAGGADAQRFSQRNVDIIDVKENALATVPFSELIKKKVDLPLELIATRNDSATGDLDAGWGWIITFDRLLSETAFTDTMKRILKTLEAAYGYPVDIEFTVNFTKSGAFQINLLQCRPVQTRGVGRRVEMPKKIARQKVIFESSGNFLGGNILQGIDRIIYVDPRAYASLATQSERYDIARAIGALNRDIGLGAKMSVMLLGPGRWGTSTPSLGVPVSFAEINHMAALGEIAFAHSNAVPELSFGTHFFQDLVETGIFYVALFPASEGVFFNQSFFDEVPRSLGSIPAHFRKYEHVIKVFNAKGRHLKLAADIVSQKVLCYFSKA